jgi:hypothetical protein
MQPLLKNLALSEYAVSKEAKGSTTPRVSKGHDGTLDLDPLGLGAMHHRPDPLDPLILEERVHLRPTHPFVYALDLRNLAVHFHRLPISEISGNV